MKINKYPDGTSYVTIETGVEGLRQAKEASIRYFTFKINNYEDLWHLNQFVDVFYSYHNVKPMILIPNLIDAQADRRFARNQSSGLKLVCQFLNNMNAEFRIFHPHNPEVVEALINNVEIIDNSEFVIKILNFLGTVKGAIQLEKDLILMSSDAGGFKPLMKLCDQLKWKGETYSASKARTKDGMKQLIDREDFGGKDILIIDDICVYGGTFKGLSKLLKERNCGKLYLAVSHMTVQDLGDDSVTLYFDKVFTTNSKYDKYYWDCDIVPNNLEIIKMF